MLSLACALAAMLSGCGDSPASPLFPTDVGVVGDGRLDDRLEVIRVGYDLPALAAMVVTSDGIEEMGAVGYRAIGYDERVTVHDRWRLNSLTKAITATLAAALVERGVVSWTTTVREVYPDLVGRVPAAYLDVPLRDFLSHTSGMPTTAIPGSAAHLTPTAPLVGSMKERRRAYVEQMFTALPPTGSRRYAYSNHGYTVAGAMLEEVTGTPWEELVRQRVFAPLGMTTSGFGWAASPGRRDQPWSHTRIDSRWWALDPAAPFGVDSIRLVTGPGGSAHASMPEYGAFVRAHLAGARGLGGFLDAASFQALHTPPAGSDYALGWIVSSRNWAGGRVLFHDGHGLGHADLWVAPGRDVAFFAVTNVSSGERERASIEATDAAIRVLILRYGLSFQ